MKKPTKIPDAALLSSPLGRLADRMLRAERIWREFDTALRSCFFEADDPRGMEADPSEVVRTLGALRLRPEFVAEVGEPLLASSEAEAVAAAEASIRAFDGELRRLSANRRISVTGRFPNYVVDGFLRVTVDVVKGITLIGGRKCPSVFARRVWMFVSSEIEEERRRRVSPEVFLAACSDAYAETLSKRNEGPGAVVPIRVLFRALQDRAQRCSTQPSVSRPRRGSGYREEYFKRDLAALISSGRFISAEGSRVEFLPSAFAKSAIPILVGDGVRYVGGVTFNPAK